MKLLTLSGYDAIDFGNIAITGTGGNGWPAGSGGTSFPVVDGEYQVDKNLNLNGNGILFTEQLGYDYGITVDDYQRLVLTKCRTDVLDVTDEIKFLDTSNNNHAECTFWNDDSYHYPNIHT